MFKEQKYCSLSKIVPDFSGRQLKNKKADWFIRSFILIAATSLKVGAQIILIIECVKDLYNLIGRIHHLN